MAKVCNRCRLEQPEANFSKKSDTPDGLRHTCKNCSNDYGKAYYGAHMGNTNERRRQCRAVNKELINVRRKISRAGRREQIREIRHQYYEAHKETMLQQNKVWVENNKGKSRKATATWAKNHSDVMKVHWQARRAKKAGLVRTLTPSQWKHILNEFNNTCAYCGVGDKTLHQEHFVPVSSDGEYTHNNIIPACGSCNSSKRAKDFFIWYPTSDGYDKKREKKIMKFLHYTGVAQQLTLCT